MYGRLRACGFSLLPVAGVFLSAALMFSIEPMVGKALLPAFGGGATVWSSVMLFFQVSVLAGYAVAHASVRRFGDRSAAAVQVTVSVAGCLCLPLVPGVVDPGAGQVASVLATLAVGYGAAAAALAGTSPLIQRWLGLRTGGDPYRLYAVSNAGSLFGLLIFPLFLDRNLTAPAQGFYWRIGFALSAVITAVCALVALGPSGGVAPGPRREMQAIPEPETPLKVRAAWVCLSVIPASLLLGVTQQLTVNIAPVPLLWILPLAVYLGSFILAFSLPVMSVRQGGLLQGLTLPLLAATAFFPPGDLSTAALGVVLHLLAFGSAALVCHGALSAMKPGRDRLTGFYLHVSLGGLIGGVFNTLAAPLLFDRLLEYPLVLAAAFLVAAPPFRSRCRIPVDMLPAAVMTALAAAASGGAGERIAAVLDNRLIGAPLIALTAAGALATSRRGAAAVLAVAMTAPLFFPPGPDVSVIRTSRDFYGPLRVTERDGRRILEHGATIHGMQWVDPARSREPLLYYWPSSGIGRLFAMLESKPRLPGKPPRTVEAVGLGAGVIACYGSADTKISFLEIDPGVAAVARDSFSFLTQCGRPPVLIGDGRLLLSRGDPGTDDLIIVDAFSSDSVPAHLLTVEAAAVFLRRLRPGGMVAFHLSNRYLELAPVVAASAAANGAAAFRYDLAALPDDAATGRSASEWAVISVDPETGRSLTADGWRRIEPRAGGPLWTDGKWDILGALKLPAGPQENLPKRDQADLD